MGMLRETARVVALERSAALAGSRASAPIPATAWPGAGGGADTCEAGAIAAEAEGESFHGTVDAARGEPV